MYMEWAHLFLSKRASIMYKHWKGAYRKHTRKKNHTDMGWENRWHDMDDIGEQFRHLLMSFIVSGNQMSIKTLLENLLYPC